MNKNILIFLLITVFININADECISECRLEINASVERYHCLTSWSVYSDCIPIKKLEKLENLYNYKSANDYICHGRCGKFSQTYDWCVSNDWNSWSYCSQTKIEPSSFWTEFKRQFETIQSKYINTIAKCEEGQSSTAVKQAVELKLNKLYKFIMDNMYKYVETEYFLEGPMKSISSVFIPGNTKRLNKKLTIAINATIYKRHALNYQCHQLNEKITKHFWSMDAKINDEIGFLLTNSFGGLPNLNNLIPQSPFTLANLNDPCIDGIPLWFRVDESLLDFLDTVDNGYIEWNLIVNYGDLPKSLRPTHFLLRVQLKNPDHSNFIKLDGIFQGKSMLELIIPNTNPIQ